MQLINLSNTDETISSLVEQKVNEAIASSATISSLVYRPYDNISSGVGSFDFDDTIPQQSEGIEFMQITIAPNSASTHLLVECSALVSEAFNFTNAIAGALFRDDAQNALASTISFDSSESAGGEFAHLAYSAIHYGYLNLSVKVPSVSTTPTTFKFRAGVNASSSTRLVFFNQVSQISRIFGGSMNSWIKVTEIFE